MVQGIFGRKNSLFKLSRQKNKSEFWGVATAVKRKLVAGKNPKSVNCKAIKLNIILVLQIQGNRS